MEIRTGASAGGGPPPPSVPLTTTSGEGTPNEVPEQLGSDEVAPKAPEETEPPCTKPKPGDLGERGSKTERDQVGEAGVKPRGEMRSGPTAPPHPTAPPMNAYTDGSYWKKLASVLYVICTACIDFFGMRLGSWSFDTIYWSFIVRCLN